MKFVLLLMILCKGIQSINGEALQCIFKDISYFGTSRYSCYVTALENLNDNKIITGYSGNHQANKYDRDVKQIYIDGTNTTYIPEGLGSLFNLFALVIHSSQLVEIRSKDFQGMQNLEYLSLYYNKLTSVPSDAFSSLVKLKYIDLESNQIKYIGSRAFDQLKNLNRVDLGSNICVNKNYDGATAITQMKEDLKVYCVEPLSTSITTTTTTTTQNPMEVELEALKNEAKDQKQKNAIELNKLRDDLKKEQSKNLKVKDEKDALKINFDVLMQDKDALKMIIDTLLKEKDVLIKENDELASEKLQKEQSENLKVKIERDALMTEKYTLMKERDDLLINHDVMEKELRNKTSEIIELNSKIQTNYKQPIEALDVKLSGMFQQLLNASQDHQMECNEIIKLKVELVTAKEEQKKEQLEYLKVTKEKDALVKKKDALMIYHNALMKDKDQLKKELTEAKATCKINERSLI
ncbi:unnamed protein product [Diamesa tonsa]